MTKQLWSRSRLWVGLAVAGLYVATLVRVLVGGGWHSQKEFSALTLVSVLAMFLGAVSQVGNERVTGPVKVRARRVAVFVLLVVGLGVHGCIRLFVWPGFNPVTQLMFDTGMLLVALALITGWTAPVPQPASAA